MRSSASVMLAGEVGCPSVRESAPPAEFTGRCETDNVPFMAMDIVEQSLDIANGTKFFLTGICGVSRNDMAALRDKENYLVRH